MIGKMVSHYRVHEKLGEGGMGVVYIGEDMRLKRTIALKFLPSDLTSDSQARERFAQEAQAASALQHSNICTVHDIDETIDGRMFIVMDCYSGQTLSQMIGQRRVSTAEAIHIAIQSGRGLAEAHLHEIVHRDIKPSNILVTTHGEVKILDFGIAALAPSKVLSSAQPGLGTLAYMSPEQLKGGSADHRADIWSLGVLLYEMLAGVPPFSSKFDQGLVYAILHEHPVPVHKRNLTVTKRLANVVHKALAKKVEQRYQSMGQLVSDLEAVATERQHTGTGRVPYRSLSVRRRRSLITVTGAALVAVAFMVWQSHIPGGSPSPPRSIAVMPCANNTGDSSYNSLQRIVPNLLITKLQTQPGLEVTTWTRLLDFGHQAGAGDIRLADRDQTFELCRMGHVEAVALPSIEQAGKFIVTHVEVVETETQRHIMSASSKGEGVSSILAYQIDDIGNQILEALSFSVTGEDSPRSSIAGITTTSMDAYECYLAGSEAFRHFDFNEARSRLEQAVRFDTSFAFAHFRLSEVLAMLGLPALSTEALTRAKRYSQKASEIERRYIYARYSGWFEGETKRHIRTYESIIRDFPKEKDAVYQLGKYYEARDLDRAIGYFRRTLMLDPNHDRALFNLGNSYMRLGEYSRAREYIERYVVLMPDNPNGPDCMGELSFRKGNLDKAMNEYQKATNLDPNFFYSWSALAYIRALREDYGPAFAYIERMITNSSSPSIAACGYRLRAFYSSWLGRSTAALEDLETSEALNSNVGSHVGLIRDRRLKAMVHYDMGNHAAGQAEFEASAPSRFARTYGGYLAGMALVGRGLCDVARGDGSSARTTLDTLDSCLGHITYRRRFLAYARNVYLAEILILEDRYRDCITHCDTMDVPRMVFFHPWEIPFNNFPALIDQRARALELAGLTNEAIAEYRRLVTFDPADETRRLIHPLYYYRLGRLCERQGMATEARRAYETFLRLWETADPERAEMKNAGMSLAALSGPREQTGVAEY